MSVTGRAWSLGVRARRRLRPLPPLDYGAVIREYAPGRSFADIGCMWNVHGDIAFLAEEAGATQVTGADVMRRTEEFDRKHRERSSKVRFVQTDLHQPESVEAVGVHDVVWCTGVIYHTPHPMRQIVHLRDMAREYLIIGSATIPEVPGVSQACVFYPGMDEGDLALHSALAGRDPESWWFGISPSAMKAMVQSAGLTVTAVHQGEGLTLMVAKT